MNSHYDADDDPTIDAAELIGQLRAERPEPKPDIVVDDTPTVEVSREQIEAVRARIQAAREEREAAARATASGFGDDLSNLYRNPEVVTPPPAPRPAPQARAATAPPASAAPPSATRSIPPPAPSSPSPVSHRSPTADLPTVTVLPSQLAQAQPAATPPPPAPSTPAPQSAPLFGAMETDRAHPLASAPEHTVPKWVPPDRLRPEQPRQVARDTGRGPWVALALLFAALCLALVGYIVLTGDNANTDEDPSVTTSVVAEVEE